MMVSNRNLFLFNLALSTVGLCFFLTYSNIRSDQHDQNPKEPEIKPAFDNEASEEDVASDYLSQDILRGAEERLKRKPNFIVIGVSKCGTGPLLSMLDMHSKIRRPERSDPDVAYFEKRQGYDRDWYIDQTGATYKDELSYEYSPQYFTNKKIPERIFNFDNKMKLILVICDPVKRFALEAMERNLLSAKPVELDEVFDIIEKITKYNKDVQKGMYAKHLESWFEWFKEKQLLIVNGNKLVSEPFEELRRVQDFLGIAQELGGDRFFLDEAQEVYCYIPDDETTKCLPEDSTPKLPMELEKKLRKIYKPWNQAIEELTGRDFYWD